MIDYRQYTSMPRSFRNNNPGNLVRTNIPWTGKIPHEENTDLKFEQFKYMEFGLRAMMMDILNDISKGLNTPRKLIEEYTRGDSPEIQYNYMNTIAKALGITRDSIIPMYKDKFRTLIETMVKFEADQTMPKGIFDTAYSILPDQRKALIKKNPANKPISNQTNLFGTVLGIGLITFFIANNN